MAVESPTSLDGWFKSRYGTEQFPIPNFVVFGEEIPFVGDAEKEGRNFNFPVKVRRGNAWTWQSGAGAVTINTPIASVMDEATVTGIQFVDRRQISWDVVHKAAAGNAAYGRSHDVIVEDLLESTQFARELMLLYGGTNIGTMESISGTGTSRAIVISKATWSPGTWVQLEGAPIDSYEDSTLATQTNTNADILISSVDPDTRTVNVTGNATDLTAVDGDANTVFVPKGTVSQWASGIDKITTNTGALFGISAATYNQWKSVTRTLSGSMNFLDVMKVAADIAVRAGMVDLCLDINTYTWADMNNDFAALRQYTDKMNGTVELGSQKIQYFGPNGKIEVRPHPMIKAGEAFVRCKKDWVRPGATDITWMLPGVPGSNQQERFYHTLENTTAYEIRSYFHQALVCQRPNRQAKISGIVNNSL